jgi:hypothetical protein
MSAWSWVKGAAKDARNLSPAYAFLGDEGIFNPNKGYETAAEGAKQASGGYRALAGEMQQGWNTGASNALGMYGQSQDLWRQQYGGQGPGAMEQYYSQNSGQFQAPTESSRALSNYQQGMGMLGGNLALGGAQAQGRLGQPSAQGQYYSQHGQQLGQPGRTADAYGQAMQTYQQPGAYENWAGGANAISSQQNARANTRNANTFGQSQQAGRSEGFQAQGYDPANVNRMQGVANNIGAMQGRNNTNASAGETGGYYRGADQAADFYGSQQRSLQGPGVYENFVTADIYGANPAKQMAMREGMSAINAQMNKRGAFNSGAAMTGLGQFAGKMEAEDYQNRANRAAQAQGMELSRIGQGTQAAQAAAQNRMTQGSSLQGLAGQQDSEQRARADQYINANQMASGEQLASGRLGLDANTQNQRLMLDAAGQSDQMKNQRLRLGLDATAQDHAQGISGLQFQGDVNRQSQQFGMDRAGNMVRDSGMADQNELARMMGGFNMSQGVDADMLARTRMGYDIDQSQHDSGLARSGMYGNLAGQQDQQQLARLMGMGNMAGNAQQAQQQRYGQAFDSMYGMNNSMASLYGQMYGAGMGAYGNAMGDSYNALANMYGLKGQGQTAYAKIPWDAANIGVEGAKKYGTGGVG